MVLAQDIDNIDNDGGLPLCGKGLSLTAAMIERLKRIGVQAIVVEGHLVTMGEGKTPEENLSMLENRFKKVLNDPRMMMLKEIYRRHLLKSM
jgi:hypothetical protein